MREPSDEWPQKFDTSTAERTVDVNDLDEPPVNSLCSRGGEHDFTFRSDPVPDEDDKVTETKIRAFLDEKALDLKKLQTPLYEEFFNCLSNKNKPCAEKQLHPRNKMSTNEVTSGVNAALFSNTPNKVSNGNYNNRRITSRGENNEILREISPQLNEWVGIKMLNKNRSTQATQRKWKEELDQELKRKREMLWKTGNGKTSSSKDEWFARKRDRMPFTSLGK